MFSISRTLFLPFLTLQPRGIWCRVIWKFAKIRYFITCSSGLATAWPGLCSFAIPVPEAALVSRLRSWIWSSPCSRCASWTVPCSARAIFHTPSSFQTLYLPIEKLGREKMSFKIGNEKKGTNASFLFLFCQSNLNIVRSISTGSKCFFPTVQLYFLSYLSGRQPKIFPLLPDVHLHF